MDRKIFRNLDIYSKRDYLYTGYFERFEEMREEIEPLMLKVSTILENKENFHKVKLCEDLAFMFFMICKTIELLDDVFILEQDLYATDERILLSECSMLRRQIDQLRQILDDKIKNFTEKEEICDGRYSKKDTAGMEGKDS